MSPHPEATEKAASIATATTAAEAHLVARLKSVEFERDLAIAEAGRVAAENRALESELAALRSDRTILQTRLADRERFVGAVESSSGWRLLEFLRRLIGRGWR